jgi:hypothetical protein
LVTNVLFLKCANRQEHLKSFTIYQLYITLFSWCMSICMCMVP